MEIDFQAFIDSISLEQVIRPLVYIAVAVIFYMILSKIIGLFFERNKDKLIEKQMNRIITLKAMTMSIIKYIIVFAVILAIMANYGIDVTSLLAGLGIAGAILGLAFQDFVKDIIAGFSIITENQYEVGDLIEVGGFKGRVTAVGLKTTRIRNYRGKVKIISNRNISELINWSRHDTLAEVIVSASYENDPDKVEDVLNKVKAELDGSMEQMTGEIKIFPVTGLNESSISYTIQCACKSYKHFAVQRAIRREVYKAFKANKIKIPYPQLEVHNSSK
ncbi:mechanosensitive ion channel family protein [Candidatus Saccharibacteria bacterium]|nr:mechanosensitive ion channel family protein [Candidatus Saccharibacteria bacterium]